MNEEKKALRAIKKVLDTQPVVGVETINSIEKFILNNEDDYKKYPVEVLNDFILAIMRIINDMKLVLKIAKLGLK